MQSLRRWGPGVFSLLPPCSISSWSKPGRYGLHAVALLLTQTALFCVAGNFFVKFMIVTVHFFYTSCILISVHHLFVLFFDPQSDLNHMYT